MNSFSISKLENKKEEIDRLAKNIIYSSLYNVNVINNFIFSENKIAAEYIKDYQNGAISFLTAHQLLQEQYDSLFKSYRELQTAQAKLYIIVERKKEQTALTNILLKQVGFISGGLQVTGGGGICVATLGMACASLGVPLILHGAENTWENGYYLILRREPNKMPLRSVYRNIAALFTDSDKAGDIAYSIGDLSLSLGTMFKFGLKPDAWRLWYYIQQDYIIGWKTMGIAGVTSELTGDSATGFTLYQINESASKKMEFRQHQSTCKAIKAPLQLILFNNPTNNDKQIKCRSPTR